MRTRQQKSSGDAGCDPALQLAQAGQAPLSPPSAYLPQQKGALISFGKYYLQVSIMEKMCHSLLLCMTNDICPQNSVKTKPTCIHDTFH